MADHEGIGVMKFLLNLIKGPPVLHEGSNVRICVNSEAFVRQGCATALFWRANDWIMERVQTTLESNCQSFSDLDYANNVWLDTSTTNLAKTLDLLETEASYLHILWAKIKLQNLSSAAHTNSFIVNGNEVVNVNQVNYLSSIQSLDSRCAHNINCIIGLAASVMRYLNVYGAKVTSSSAQSCMSSSRASFPF